MSQEPQMHVNEYGTKIWKLNGNYHREDGPAIEYANGTKAWLQCGKLHRTNGAAIEWLDGAKEWYVDGVRHRVDGAAVEYADGSKFWYVDGMMYYDVAAWAKMALQYEHKEATQEAIDAKVAAVMQQDFFN